jgi:hypothetical protein
MQDRRDNRLLTMSFPRLINDLGLWPRGTGELWPVVAELMKLARNLCRFGTR